MYILFVGSHDRCDTWLDSNSKGKPHQTEVPMVCYEIEQKKQRQTGPAPPSPADPEEDLCDRMPMVSQKDLRKVFSGLVRNGQAQ